MARVMGKHVAAEVARYEADVKGKDGDKVAHKKGDLKGSPLQSKINSFTNGKPIIEVLTAVVRPGIEKRTVDVKDKDSGEVSQVEKEFFDAGLVYRIATDDEDTSDILRVFSKVLDAPIDADFQKKINAFTGGKDINVTNVAVSDVRPDGMVSIVMLYTKAGVKFDQGRDDGDSAAEAPAEQETAAV